MASNHIAHITAPRSFRAPGAHAQLSAPAGSLAASNETLGYNSTRDGGSRSRQSLPQGPDSARPKLGGTSVAPIDAKAFFGKDFLKKFSNGLEGFGRPDDAKVVRRESLPPPPTGPPSLSKGSPNILKQSNRPFVPPDSVPLNQNLTASSHPRLRQYLVTPVQGHDSEPLQFEFKKPFSVRSAYTRSSTPARDVDFQDTESHAPVDYAVFQSLMVAQSKKEKLLKDKDDEIVDLEHRVQEIKSENDALVAKLDKVKKETKTYVQNCEKLVRSVQREAQEYQESSRQAYRNSIDDLKANMPQLQSIKSELAEQMQNIELQLEEEHHHRERIGQDMLRELESSKHAVDFLRDKLMMATSDLVEAKNRVQELEQASGQENLALQQALRLLEDTRVELSVTRQSAITSPEDKHLLEEVENQFKEEMKAASNRVTELQQKIGQKDEGAQKKQKELDCLNVLLAERTSEVSRLRSLAEELSQTRDKFQAKDKELAVLHEQHNAALKKMAEMNANVERDDVVHHRLEDALCRAAALESQQAEHAAICVGQKERLQQTEKDLKMMEDQYNQTKLRLEKALREVESLDNRYEDFKAISRGTKQEVVELQTQLTDAREELKASRINTESRLEKHSHERKALEQLLEMNAQALGKMQEEFIRTKSEKAQIELQMQNDPEKAQLRTSLRELERQALAERDDHQATVVSLQKQLQASTAVTEELRGNIELQSVQLAEVRKDKEIISTENAKLAQELTNILASSQDTVASLDKLRSTHQSALQLHAQELKAVEDRLIKAQSALSSTVADLNQSQLRIQHLEEQKLDLAHLSESRLVELQQANERWHLVEQKMEALTLDFSDAKSSIQKAISNRESPDETKEDASGIVEAQVDDEAKAELERLGDEVEVLAKRNSELEELSLSIVERYGNGELTEQEANLVKQVVKSTMHVNQKELVQKANDLKRRDATIQALEKRIVELEKQLASRFARKAPTGQLMTVRDIVTSSPLSTTEEQLVIQQANPFPSSSKSMSFVQTYHAATNSKVVTPARIAPSDIKPNLDQFARPTPTPTRADAHSDHHQNTFALLNRSASEDDIRQFSDKSPTTLESEKAVTHTLRASTRNGKRGRYEEVDAGEEEVVMTRATRRRKLSGTAERPVIPVSGLRKGTTVRGGARAGQSEATSNAAAKYKAAQRGKIQR